MTSVRGISKLDTFSELSNNTIFLYTKDIDTLVGKFVKEQYREVVKHIMPKKVLLTCDAWEIWYGKSEVNPIVSLAIEYPHTFEYIDWNKVYNYYDFAIAKTCIHSGCVTTTNLLFEYLADNYPRVFIKVYEHRVMHGF